MLPSEGAGTAHRGAVHVYRKSTAGAVDSQNTVGPTGIWAAFEAVLMVVVLVLWEHDLGVHTYPPWCLVYRGE